MERKQAGKSNSATWKKKYQAVLNSYPLAIIEIEKEFLVSAEKSVFPMLGLDDKKDKIPLADIFVEADDLAHPPFRSSYVMHSNETGRAYRLTQVYRFSKHNRLYQLQDIRNAPVNNELSDTSLKPDPFRNLIEQSTDGICLINQEGIILEWNNAMTELYEVERERYLNKPVWEFDYDYLPERRKNSSEKKRIKQIIDNYLNNPEKTTFFGEYEKEVEGKTKFIQYRVFPFQTDEGKLFARINTDITDRKISELKLQEYKTQLEEQYKSRTLDWQQSEARLRLLVQSVPIAFYSFEKSDRSTMWYSEQIEFLSGYSTKELEENPDFWVSRINSEDYARLAGTFDAIKPNEKVSCEYRWKDVKDQEIWIFDQAVLIEATESHPEQIVGCFMDISERKQAEISIMESERNYREIFNSSNDAILIQNAKTGAIEDVNETMLSMFGASYNEALKANLSAFSANNQKFSGNTILKKLEQALIHDNLQFEWLARKADGTLFWVDIILKTIVIDREAKIMAVIRDIDQKKKTDEQLKINEEKYRLMIEGQTDLITKVDTEGKFLFASPSYCELFNKTEEELLDKQFSPFIHENDKETTEKAFEKLFTEPHTSYIEHRAHTKNGWRWIAWNYKAILNQHNEVKEIMGVGRDMTYQKGVEEALRSSEDRFRSIVQRLSDIIFICDADSFIIYDTPTVHSILGYHEGHLVGQKLFDFVHAEDIDIANEKMKTILQKENNFVKAEIRIKKCDGTYIPMEGTGINLLHHQAIRGIVVTLRDISERKMLDKKILDAVIKTEEQERERFAKNLHDDLGPLLSSIKMYISSFTTTNDPEKQEFIIEQLNEVVKEAITTTKEVSNDLSPHILINYGLIAAIDNFIKKLPSNIKVNLQSTLPSDRYSNTIENSFYRIIKELINNTLKHAEASRININLEERGHELSLSYSDNGKGISLDKLNPAQTKGMGISNIISRSKSLNGKYQFASDNGQGFSFNITIPIHQPLD